MPSELLCFRPACGQFVFIFQHFMSKRSEYKIAMRKAMLKVQTYSDGATLGLLFTLFCFGNLLILSGDVESNPGPPKNSNKQTRLTLESRTRKASTDNVQSEAPSSTQSTVSQPTLRDIMDLLCSMNNSWDQAFPSSKATDNSESATASTSRDVPAAEESSSKDLMSLLNEMNIKFDNMKTNLMQLTNMCAQIQSEVSNLKQEMKNLKNEHEDIQKENCVLKNKIETLEKKADYQEFVSKRNNLIFHGVFRKEKETRDDCEQTIHRLLRDKLQLSEDIRLDEVHRLNKMPNSPIIARFSFFQQREMVLRSRRKLQGTKIFVTPDLPLRIREMRRKLLPFLKEAKTANKRAVLAYDYLIIDGNKYSFDQEGLKLRN